MLLKTNICVLVVLPREISEDVCLAFDDTLSERRHHQLTILPNLGPDESHPHLGRGAGHLRHREERLHVGGQGGHRAVGVAGGVHRQATPRQQGVDAFQ